MSDPLTKLPERSSGSGIFYPNWIRLEAFELYRKGLSCRLVEQVLTRRHGTSPSQETIHRWCEEEGISRTRSDANRLMNARRNGIHYGDDMERMSVRLYLGRLWSTAQIAAELGVSTSTVRRWLRAHRVKRRSAAECRFVQTWCADRPEVEERWAKVYAAYVWHFKSTPRIPYHEIARRLGCGEAMAFRWPRWWRSSLRRSPDDPMKKRMAEGRMLAERTWLRRDNDLEGE